MSVLKIHIAFFFHADLYSVINRMLVQSIVKLLSFSKFIHSLLHSKF